MIIGQSEQNGDTVVSALAAALRRDIAFGTLPAESRLKPDDLRVRYGGSHHSIRETLRLLSAEGLVEATAQRGFRVAPMSAADADDLYALFVEIGRVAVAGYPQPVPKEALDALGAARSRLDAADRAVAAAGDDLAILEWDDAGLAFFLAVAAPGGSPRVRQLFEGLIHQMRRYRLAGLKVGALDVSARAAHRKALVGALAATDRSAAQRHFQALLAAEFRLKR